MKNVLIIDDQEDILEILEIYIEGSFENLIVHKAFNGREAVEILEEEDFDSIICDFRMPGGNGDIVFNYNLENSNIPFAWHSSTFREDVGSIDENNNVFSLTKPVDEDELTSVLKNMIELANYENKFYRRIKPEILKKANITFISVFHKMPDGKFIQISSAEDDNLVERVELYETKGLDYLYLKKNDLDKVFKRKYQELQKKIEQTGSVEDVYFVTSEVIDDFYNDLESRGISREQIELANRCIAKCLKEFNQDIKIRELLANLINETNYVSSHSLMTIHVANALLKGTGLQEDCLEVISQAAILHDLKLPNMRLARIRDFNSEDYKKLSLSEKKLVMSHGIELATHLHDKNISQEVIKLVQNHELFGNEIKRGVELSDLELFFHFSHEVAHYICEIGFDQTLATLLNNEPTYKALVGNELFKRVTQFLDND